MTRTVRKAGVPLRRRIAPTRAAAKPRVIVSDHAASQLDGPCHGYTAPYYDKGPHPPAGMAGGTLRACAVRAADGSMAPPLSDSYSYSAPEFRRYARH